MDIGSEFETERAHRSPSTHPEENQPLRLIMIRFLCSARDKVLKAAKGEQGSSVEWMQIFTVPRHDKRFD